MKKRAFLLLALFASLWLVSCNPPSPDPNVDETTRAAPEELIDAGPPPGEVEPVSTALSAILGRSEEYRSDPPPRPVTREVLHYIGRYRPARALPLLVSHTPAPHPLDPRPYFANVWGFSHGVVTKVQPRLRRTTLQDGLPFFLGWKAWFDGARVSREIDLPATLSATRFQFEDPKGHAHELRVNPSAGVFGASRLLIVVSAAGIELREGAVETYLKPTPPLLLAWKGGTQAKLEQPGRWRVRMKGELHTFKHEPLPYESSWMAFNLEPAESDVLPLERVRSRAAKLLKEHPTSGDAHARFWALLADNAAGNRVVVFDRGPGSMDWSLVTTDVELSPSGKLVGLRSGVRHTCVAEGTSIETTRGPVPVEHVAVGDQILSFDTTSGQSIWSTVEHIRPGWAERVLVINGELKITGEHPVWMNGQWSNASSIRPGEQLLAATGTRSTVTSIAAKEQVTRVYDLSVTAPHNYFADGVLVHNKSIPTPPSHAWRYDNDMVRPSELLNVIETTHPPISKCYAEDTAYGKHALPVIDSFVIEAGGGGARLAVLRPMEWQSAYRWGLGTARTVLQRCIDHAFDELGKAYAFADLANPAYFRFRIGAPGPRVEQVPTLTRDDVLQTAKNRAPLLRACVDDLASHNRALHDAMKKRPAVAVEVTINFRGPEGERNSGGSVSVDDWSYRTTRETAAAVDDRHSDAFSACVEHTLHPSWFDGMPSKCDGVVTVEYRFLRDEATKVALTKAQPERKDRSRCLFAALDAGIAPRLAAPPPTQKQLRARSSRATRPTRCEEERRSAAAYPILALPGPNLACDAPCEQAFDCNFQQWLPSGMAFDCPGEIYIATTSHEDLRRRPDPPTNFPVTIRIAKTDTGQWLTVRARDALAGYKKGEILVAAGRGETLVPPSAPAFFTPVRVKFADWRTIEFRDRTQWTQMDETNSCYSSDGHYFLAYSKARRPEEHPRFLVLNAR